MATKIVIKIKNSDKLIAIDEMPLGNNINIDDLDATIEVVDVPSRPRRSSQERNPLHPNALTLTDLRVGMRIHVHYTGSCPWVRSYSAVVVGKPTTNDLGFQIIPVVTDDMEYKLGFVSDMGLAPSRVGNIWNRSWYTTIAD